MTTLQVLVGFAHTVAAAGVAVSPDRTQAMVRALAELDVTSRADTYWAGRLTLCASPADIERYDRAFAAWFAGEQAPTMRAVQVVHVPRDVVIPGPGVQNADGAEPSRAATASDLEVLRHRDVATLTGPERAEVARLLALLEGPAAERPSRRLAPAHRGRLDRGRTVRAMLERGGEPARLLRRKPGHRARKLVLLVDVSGSMAPYADTTLRFAHACARRRAGTEVFTLGTRLTRVTRELRQPSADAALASVSAAVADWSGGTRLGADLKQFLDRYGQRGTARGAIAVIASDGWERGDPALLAQQSARLARLAHRVVWVNPHKARPGYAPVTAGMAAALPYVDDFVEGHTLAAFEQLAALLSRGGRRHA